MRDDLSPTRVNAARIVAFAADCLQIVFFPAFVEGGFSILDDVLDVFVAALLFALIGFHWALLPSFLAKLIPGVDLVPTWTASIFVATGFGSTKPTTSAQPPIDVHATPVEPPQIPPPASKP
jgi:hypothetical protein